MQPMLSEAVAEMIALGPTKTELFAGAVIETVGGTMSGGGAIPFVAVSVLKALKPWFPALSKPLICQVWIPRATLRVIGVPVVFVAAALPSSRRTAVAAPERPPSSIE